MKRVLLNIIFGAISLFPVCVAHAAPSLEDYGQLAEIQQMAISPDGNYIAFRNVKSESDYVLVVSLKDGKRVSGLDVTNVKPRYLKFFNNEEVLLFASDHTRVFGFGGKFELSTAFSFNINTKKVKQLLRPGDGVVYPGQTGLGKIVGYSPDGKYAYMPAYYGDPTVVMGEWVDPSYVLLRVRVGASGKPRRYKLGPYEAQDYFVDKKGEVVAREDFDESKNLHLIHIYEGKKLREIFREETPYKTKSFVGLTEDEKNLVMIKTSKKTGRQAFYTLSLKNGEIEGPFHDNAKADIVSVITDPQRIVLGLEYSGFTPTYKFFNEKLNERVKQIQAQFPEHAVSIVDHSTDWKHIVVLVEGSQAAGDYFLFSEGKPAAFITSSRPSIKPENIHPVGTVAFTARDGLKIPTLVTIPRDHVADMKNLPAVIMPHGGPASYDQIGFDFIAQALSEQGYIVIKPQFRGSSGFGIDHLVAGYGEWGGKMQDDISDAVKFFTDQKIIDPTRVCILGASYGGYAALAGGAFTPELYKCVVSINGIGDLYDFRSWIKSETGRSSEAVAYWETQIGDDNFTKAGAKERSPAHFVENFKAPVLLIHGEDDEVVPPSQSKGMYKALKKADKPVEYVGLEGDDHYLSLGETRIQSLKAAIEFINKNI